MAGGDTISVAVCTIGTGGTTTINQPGFINQGLTLAWNSFMKPAFYGAIVGAARCVYCELRFWHFRAAQLVLRTIFWQL